MKSMLPFRIATIIALMCCLNFAVPSLKAQLEYPIEDELIADIASKTEQAVVRIRVKLPENGLSTGTGFIVESSGVIITNYHVIDNGLFANVELHDGRVLTCEGIIAFDKQNDWAIIKVEAFGLATLGLGNSDSVRKGYRVLTVGNALGELKDNFTLGRISGKSIMQDGSMRLMNTVAISPGNSGGPLVTMKDEVVGITRGSIKREDAQMLNIAVPINYVRAALEKARKNDYAVKYSFADLAKADSKKDVKSPVAGVPAFDESKFTSYTLGVCTIKLPNSPNEWKSDRRESWNNDNSVFEKVVGVSNLAAEKTGIVSGWLSEGIRATLRQPSNGKIFTQYGSAWASGYATTQATEGFQSSKVDSIKSGNEMIYLFTLSGQNKEISKPEQTLFLLIGRPEYRIVLEFVAPEDKWNRYKELYKYIIGELQWQSNKQ